MYVESWQVAVVLIWLIYLLYRTSVWSNKVQFITNEYEKLLQSCSNKKRYRTKDLVYVILKFNQDILKKAPKKTQEKILADEAEKIVITIYNYNTDPQDNPAWIELWELFQIHGVPLPPYDDGRSRLNCRRTTEQLAERLSELMDEDITYLTE